MLDISLFCASCPSMYLFISVLWDPQHLSGCTWKESSQFPVAHGCAIPGPWLIPVDRRSAGTLDSRMAVLKLSIISIASGSSFHWLFFLSVVNRTAQRGSLEKGLDLGQLGPLAWQSESNLRTDPYIKESACLDVPLLSSTAVAIWAHWWICKAQASFPSTEQAANTLVAQVCATTACEMLIKACDMCQHVIWVPKGMVELKEIPRLNILSLRSRCLWLMGCYGQGKFSTGTLSISTMLESPGLSFHQLLTMPGLISEKLQDSWDMYRPCVIEGRSPLRLTVICSALFWVFTEYSNFFSIPISITLVCCSL